MSEREPLLPGTPLTRGYSSARAEYERTPWWRFLRRRKLREEMRLFGAAVAASVRRPLP